MAYKAFLSHSMAAEDLGFVYEVARQAHGSEVTCYIAERDYQLGQSLPDKIEQNIRDSDCMVVFLTKGGHHSPWVNQEVGFARACKKLIIPVVESGITPTGFLVGLEYLQINRNEPVQAMTILGKYLAQLKAEKDKNELATAAVIAGGVILLLLLSGGSAQGGGGTGPTRGI